MHRSVKKPGKHGSSYVNLVPKWDKNTINIISAWHKTVFDLKFTYTKLRMESLIKGLRLDAPLIHVLWWDERPCSPIFSWKKYEFIVYILLSLR